MDYKEKYEKALEKMKGMRTSWETLSYNGKMLLQDLESIFPELKESGESEDEKIREELIAEVKEQIDCILAPDCRDNEDEKVLKKFNKWLAWLEKQGEKPQGKSALEAIKEDKIDNQNCVKPTDKFEPKVGDWIVNNISKDVFLIKSINSGYCILEDIKGNIISPCLPPCESESHLWTIADAKAGDVLYMDNGLSTCTFIYKSINNVVIQKYASYNKFGFEGTSYIVLNDGYVCPATKEQRDTLFAKMKEAGYEWDANKKELKKIEPKPAWSEEDELNLNQAIYVCHQNGYTAVENWLKSLKGRVQPQQKVEWNEDDTDMFGSILATLSMCMNNTQIPADNRKIIKKEYEWFNKLYDRCLPKQEWSEEKREDWENDFNDNELKRNYENRTC